MRIAPVGLAVQEAGAVQPSPLPLAVATAVLAARPEFVGYDVDTSLWVRLRRLLNKANWDRAEIFVKRWEP
ncbi:MAG: hypothetical protein WCQ89_23310, partial [Verrucomicrobiota bacterium]